MRDIFTNNIRKIKFAAIGFGIVVISAAATITIIKLVYKAPVTTTANNTVSISPTELIKKYTDSYKLDGYTVSTTTSDSTIKYKLSDATYTIQINSRDNVQFSKADNSTADDLKHAIDNAGTYMTSNHMTKSSEQIITNAAEITYDSTNVVCKISSNLDSIKKSSTYGLVCVDRQAFVAEHNSIQSLINLYKQSSGTVDFKDVVKTNYSEGNKSLSLLSITPQDTTKTPYTLIFAAIDGNWTYVGQRVTPSVDVKDSFQLSSALKTAINDPKYGGFLAKYIY